MSEIPEIRGGATPDETAAVMAAIALLLDEERQAAAGRVDRRSISNWVQLGRFAQPARERSGRLPSRFAQPFQD